MEPPFVRSFSVTGSEGRVTQVGGPPMTHRTKWSQAPESGARHHFVRASAGVTGGRTRSYYISQSLDENTIAFALGMTALVVTSFMAARFGLRDVVLNVGVGLAIEAGMQGYRMLHGEKFDFVSFGVTALACSLTGGIGRLASFKKAWDAERFLGRNLVYLAGFGAADGAISGGVDGGIHAWTQGENVMRAACIGAGIGAATGAVGMTVMKGIATAKRGIARKMLEREGDLELQTIGRPAILDPDLGRAYEECGDRLTRLQELAGPRSEVARAVDAVREARLDLTVHGPVTSEHRRISRQVRTMGTGEYARIAAETDHEMAERGIRRVTGRMIVLEADIARLREQARRIATGERPVIRSFLARQAGDDGELTAVTGRVRRLVGESAEGSAVHQEASDTLRRLERLRGEAAVLTDSDDVARVLNLEDDVAEAVAEAEDATTRLAAVSAKPPVKPS